MYSSALDPSSALPETVIFNKDLLHSMEGERLATLEQALAELQAKDANTQHKLDILISHIPQSEPIPVYNVDGTLNEAGSITEVVDLILRYRNHSEQTLFAVTCLGKQKLILGHSWLQKHNLEIDWVTGEVKMSRCPP